MSSKQNQKHSAEENSNDTIQGTNNNGPSNSEQLDKLKEASYQANYKEALGRYLGPLLYDNIAPYLEAQEWKSSAKGLLDSIFSKLLSGANDQRNLNLSAKAQAELSQMMVQELSPFVEGFLASEKGQAFSNYLKDVVGNNPYPVAGVVLLAAVGAILADMDLPTIKQKFGITDNLSATIEAELGSIQNIALEAVKTTLEYTSENIKASLSVSRSEDGKLSGSASTQLGSDERHIKGDVSINEDKLIVYGLEGLYTLDSGTSLSAGVKGSSESPLSNLTLGIQTKRDEVTHSSGLDYNPSDNTLALKYGRAEQQGLSLNGVLQGNEQGMESANANGQYRFRDQDLTVGGGYSHNFQENTHQYNAFSKYKSADKKLALQGSLSGTNTGLQSMGLSSQYNPDERSSYSASYSHDFDSSRHSLDLMAQQKFGDLSLRGSQQFQYGGEQGFASNTELLGAYRMNNDLSLIGGAEYRHDQQGGKVLPKAGIQYKDIPIVITYDPEQKSTSVGLVLKF